MPNNTSTSVGLRLLFAAALLLIVLAGTVTASVEAVEPGVNCSSYDGETCVVDIGDIWFCEELYTEDVCPTSIRAGDTVRWEYDSSGIFFHTTSECGEDCDSPTATPLWDSDSLLPGEAFEFTFTTPGMYLYYCTVHPTIQRGIIRVLEEDATATPPAASTTGDVNCNGSIDSIDAALVLQLTAGLVGSLSCQQNADANEDGSTNSIDAALILQLTAGLLSNLPP